MTLMEAQNNATRVSVLLSSRADGLQNRFEALRQRDQDDADTLVDAEALKAEVTVVSKAVSEVLAATVQMRGVLAIMLWEIEMHRGV